jgi:hypothetical protein
MRDPKRGSPHCTSNTSEHIIAGQIGCGRGDSTVADTSTTARFPLVAPCFNNPSNLSGTVGPVTRGSLSECDLHSLPDRGELMEGSRRELVQVRPAPVGERLPCEGSMLSWFVLRDVIRAARCEAADTMAGSCDVRR